MKILSRLKSMVNRSNLAKFAVCVAYSASLVFVPLSSASAAPAIVPVAAESVYALLVALGLLVGNETSGYVWNTEVDPYTSSVFEKQVAGITSGIPIAEDSVGSLVGTVIPNNIYTTDGTDFYVGSKKVEPFSGSKNTSDLFLLAKSLVGVNYSVPTNIIGAQATVGEWSETKNGKTYSYGISFSSKSDIDKDIYYVPFVIDSSDRSYILSNSFTVHSRSGSDRVDVTRYNWINNKSERYSNLYFGKYYYYNISPPFSSSIVMTSDSLNGNLQVFCPPVDPVEYVPAIGITPLSYGSGMSYTLLTTKGIPSRVVVADSEKLGDSVLQVKKSDDDDNNPVTPPSPESPKNWQIWQTVDELVEELETLVDTNGDTDLGQFVDNDYVYNHVDVDINVPDEIDNNVNLSGGLDINGKGDVNVTIHEDISLPSAGDGSGFYNPDAADVVGALGKDNPVAGVISGIFSAIDPALLGVFSVSVSLLFVLGLWKLIRG